MKWLRYTAYGLGGLILLCVGVVLLMVNTAPGTRWLVRTAERALESALTIERVEGDLAGPLTMTGLTYRNAVTGLELRAREVHFDVGITSLLLGRLHVEDFTARGIDLVLGQAVPPEEEPAPFSLEPPIDIVLDRVLIEDFEVRRDTGVLVVVDTATLTGRWTAAGVVVQRLNVHSPQGRVQFAGNVEQEELYFGSGAGQFRWRQGDLTYAGSLRVEGNRPRASLVLDLDSPLEAKLFASVTQAAQLPWRAHLEVPQFDPRRLLPATSVQTLAASLDGEGTLAGAKLSGRVRIDGESALLETLQLGFQTKVIELERLVLQLGESPGSIQGGGKIQLTDEGPEAQLQLDWQRVLIPERWVGQKLATAGRLRFDGSANRFTARGRLSLGPPGREADVVLIAKRADSSIELERFDIAQEGTGRLAARGVLVLEPQLSWDLSAQATDFDPGAFLAAWPGKLGFEVASEGKLLAEGADATLNLTNLRGRLRDRRLSGAGSLALTPAPVLAGNLELRSGSSTVRVRGQRGERMDAVITLNIATLDDWLPEATGKVAGEFTVRGKWPQWRVSGALRGDELQLAKNSSSQLTLQVDGEDPKNPAGVVRLRARDVSVAGMHFERLVARFEGNQQNHRLELEAPGEPLGITLRASGGMANAGWKGTVAMLALDVKDIRRFALANPMEIAMESGGLRVSDSCLSGGEAQVCLGFTRESGGALRGDYRIEQLPLGFVTALAAAELPIAADGVLEGRGRFARSAEGVLQGELTIGLPAGELARTVDAARGERQTLLTYRDIRLVATLSGTQARARLSGQLGERGALSGELTASDVDTATGALRGQVAVDVPSLAPLALFVPQLDHLDGRANARVGIAGTLAAPRISGELTAADVAADLPALGLELRRGQLDIQPGNNGEFTVAGSVASGDGQVRFDGMVSPLGAVQMQIKGSRFLAADIPSARVVAAPDLTFRRESERMELNGTLRLPRAEVNLQKLPSGNKGVSASPDVVVIDAQTQVEAAATRTPLFATITVELGEEVELTGYGLNARVTGTIVVKETPGEPTTGSGQIGIAGTYKAYGQDLTIRQGQLLYAGAPLDNPALNFTAVREVGEVTAGLRASGTARRPELVVFSDPMMGDANALSYLVAGKPIDAIGSGSDSGAETDALQSAARSVGAAAGGLLAKKVGKRIGVDELSIKDSEVLGGSVFSIGQYLSPRVFLSYGVGLFEPGEVITLRYKINDDFSVQALRGPEQTRAGVEYRVER